MIYTIEIASSKINDLFKNWKVEPMHTNDHDGVQENTFYVSESGLVIAEIKDEQKALFESNNVSFKEISNKYKPLELQDWFPLESEVAGLRNEDWIFGGHTVEIAGSQYSQGRTIDDDILIKNPSYEYAGVYRLQDEGYTGKGIRVGCIVGDLTKATAKDYGIPITDTYRFGAPDNKIPAAPLFDEEHAVNCATLINGTRYIKSGLPNCELYVASVATLVASIDWLISKDCKIIVISYAGGNAIGEVKSLLAKQSDIAIVVAAGNTYGTDKVLNELATRSTVNVNIFQGFPAFLYLPTGRIDRSKFTNALPNERGAKVDFAVQAGHLTAGWDNENTYARLVGGSSLSVMVAVSLLGLLKEKHPNYPMRTLVELLKITSRNAEKLIGSDYPIPTGKY
mgnify:CR=1 FL=1